MPAFEALTERGLAMLDDLPTVVRDDPHFRAVVHCYAREFDRLEELATQLRDGFIPESATPLTLPAWELLLRIAPTGTEEERRNRVLAALPALFGDPSGLSWEDGVTALVGPGWEYTEDTATFTLNLVLPVLPPELPQLEAVIREFTPAHLDLVLASSAGFLLDQSQLDQEGLDVP